MMAGILVFVEQRDGEIRKASHQAISEAKRQGGMVIAVLPGSGVGDAAAGLGAEIVIETYYPVHLGSGQAHAAGDARHRVGRNVTEVTLDGVQ